MPNISTKENPYSLSKLCKGIEQLISDRLGHQYFWVVAELSKIKLQNNGFIYLNLVELENNKVVADVKGMMWPQTRVQVETKLASDFVNVFKDGNKVLLKVKVSYSAVYGFSFDLLDVDLNFSIGEIEKRKRETLRRLRAEKRLTPNKRLKLPIIIERILVVGAKNSDGYKDFKQTLEKNSKRFTFDFEILNTQVQGNSAVKQMIDRLDTADKCAGKIDLIVLVRGGGSKLDLEPFNSYELCKRISELKIPLIAGIGHDEDISLADLTAHLFFKTPTAVAEHILQRSLYFENGLFNVYEAIARLSQRTHQRKNEQLNMNAQKLKDRSINLTGSLRHYLTMNLTKLNTGAERLFAEQKNLVDSGIKNIQIIQQRVKNQFEKALELSSQSIATASINRINTVERARINQILKELEIHIPKLLKGKVQILDAFSNSVNLMNPEKLVKQGFAIVYDSNGILKKSTKLEVGDSIVLDVYEQKISCEITKLETNEN